MYKIGTYRIQKLSFKRPKYLYTSFSLGFSSYEYFVKTLNICKSLFFFKMFSSFYFLR